MSNVIFEIVYIYQQKATWLFHYFLRMVISKYRNVTIYPAANEIVI